MVSNLPEQQDQYDGHSLETAMYELSAPNTALNHGQEVPRAIWEPLLGGEMQALWETLLTSDGDSCSISGSLVAKMAIGVYASDIETRQVPTNMRSDTDIVCSPQIFTRLQGSKFEHGSTHISTLAEVGGMEFDVVSESDMRNTNLKALAELSTAVDDWDPLHKLTFQAQIDNLSTLVAAADQSELLAINNIFPIETLSLKLVREAGELHCYFMDPTGFLSSYEIQQGLKIMREAKTYFGLAQRDINQASVQALYLDALSEGFPNDPTFSTKIPLYVYNALPRMIVKSTEQHIDFLEASTLFEDFYNLPTFTKLYKLGDAAAQGILPFKMSGELAQRFPNNESMRDWFQIKTQEAFARSCASDPATAFDMCFVWFDLAPLFSEDLAKVFEEYHKISPPNYIFRKTVHDAFVAGYLPSPECLTKVAVTLLQIDSIVDARYGRTDVELKVENQSSEMSFPEAKRFPSTMSEVMAIFCTGLMWDPAVDAEKIDSIVENWKLSGELKSFWKTSPHTFDMSVNKADIIKYMEEMRRI